ncbi:MAG TPA: hypothetical protein VF251_11070 [Pyrinomonadaceae bacterium]
MKLAVDRLPLYFASALCTFALGLAASYGLLKLTDAASVSDSIRPLTLGSDCRLTGYAQAIESTGHPIVLDYCEVASAPECYSGKLLQVNAVLTGDGHGIFFFGDGCESQRTAGMMTSMSEAEFQAVWANPAGNRLPWQRDVSVLGRFEMVTPSRESNLNWHNMPMRVQVLRILKR